MKYILITIIYLTMTISSYSSEKEKCITAFSILKPNCNIIGKSVKKLKNFSSKNKTIGQSIENFKKKK